MKIPNFQCVEIHPNKITKYLLDKEHVDGGDKADYFIGVGFRLDQWEEFAQVLRVHGSSYEVAGVLEREHGMVYIVEGEIEAPNGETPYVRSVWQINWEDDHPRLITAYHIGS